MSMQESDDNILLTEAKARAFMTDREKALKKALIRLLRDDGKGHHHAKYAARLEKFDVNIVPLAADPRFTAAISFDDGVIFVGEGLLADPSVFGQLNVILRHELSHNLLMHQIRLMRKIPNYDKIAKSATIHDLLNILEDDEISNKRYTDEDKETVRNIWLNGKIISGLVTEDHRPEWQNLTLEEMCDKLEEEIANITTAINSNGKVKVPMHTADPTKDQITLSVISAYNAYQDINAKSIIKGPLKDFIDNGCKVMTPVGIKQWNEDFRALAKKLFDSATAEGISDAAVDDLLKQIAATAINKQITIFSGSNSITLYTPEEKYVAEEVLKKYRTEYHEWYEKVKDMMTNDLEQDTGINPTDAAIYLLNNVIKD